MMIWIHRIVFAAIIFYVALAALAFFAQRKILYFPPNFYHSPPAEMVEIRTPSGALGWYSSAMNDRPTVMIFHGNASSIDSNMHIFRDLQTAGYGVWSVGYPGYPGSSGKPTQANLVASATAQYEHLSKMGVENVVYYGTSLGAGVAAQLAAQHQPRLLITDAPFNSVLDMAHRQMPLFPTAVLVKDKWRSDQALTGLNVPLVWIHGTSDNVIPIAQGRKLYEGYTGPKTAHVLEGAGHNNTWLNGGREVVLAALEKL
ncbi:MAG: alpha/beta fold hydrolase [Litorimonas sp.]